MSVVTFAVSPRILDTLRQLGLTEYAARCYVALLTLKSAEAAAIAEAAEVPRTKVYATLKDLVDAGWVVASSGRPVVYRPVAPDERIHEAEKRFTQEVADATRELSARFEGQAEMIPVSFYMLRGQDVVDAKEVELATRAREELLVNIGFARPGEGAALAEALRKATRRGVVVRMLLGRGVPRAPWGELGAEARAALFPFRAIVCDRRQALMTLPAQEDPLALWNPTQVFVEKLAPVLARAWEEAPPLS